MPFSTVLICFIALPGADEAARVTAVFKAATAATPGVWFVTVRYIGDIGVAKFC